MEIPTLILLLSCAFSSLASEHSHTIPVEGYETELQELGEHVEIPVPPVKIVKITKTVAVKVPVPYPVKVIEKVPYPVHINKPYPVPVPQIVKVPVAKDHGEHHEAIQPIHPHGLDAYQVQEQQHEGEGQSYPPAQGNHGEFAEYHGEPQQFGAVNEYPSDGSTGSSYGQPESYHGYGDDSEGHGSLESKTYDRAIKEYLNKHHPNWNNGITGGQHY